MSKLLSTFIIIFATNFCEGIGLNKLNRNVSNYPFDKKLYEDVLNPELCEKQLSSLNTNNTGLLLQFIDASARIPRGILLGNTQDLGNYQQCLNINEYLEDINIQGKYCMTQILVNQNMFRRLRFLERSYNYETIDDLHKNNFNITTKNDNLNRHLNRIFGIQGYDSRIGPESREERLSSINFHLAICIPKPCSPREAIDALFTNLTDWDLDFKEEFCRLPNDKPWVPSDYVAIIIFSIILVLIILSTCYDIWYSIIREKDKKEMSTLYKSFSVYTNTQRLLTFKAASEPLHCIDGIRALAMIWVVIGHTLALLLYSINLLDGLQWATSRNAMWITAAPITVDTFFMLSGLLIVYTTAGKLSSIQLLKNIHLYYLNRLLRMFPILAAMILYEVSFHNRLFDGPNWHHSVDSILSCRQFWWSALLHIQNLYNPQNMCLPVTWYLSVDVQLHFLSPVILVWVLTEKKTMAWTALTGGLVISIAAATIYCFMNNFRSGSFSKDLKEIERYHIYYYVNTLTRASPFFVGMIFGYVLHLWKGKHPQIPKAAVIILWSCALLLLAGVIYCVPLYLQEGWNNQLADNLLNSFMRPAWALGLGWLIFACTKGYGGPINWFLSLDIWKLPARLSYAVYIIHLTLITSIYSSSNAQSYFTVSQLLFDATAFLFITTILAFVVTVTIDAPFSTLTKLLLNTDNKKIRPETRSDIEVNKRKEEF